MASFSGLWMSFSVKFTGIIISFNTYISREQHIPNSRNANLIFIVFSLLSFLQIKSQGNPNDSPFQTHPKTCNFAIAMLLLYGLAYDAEQSFCATNLSRCANVARRVMGLFGSLLVSSLASVLFSGWVLPVLLFVYILVYADELMDLLRRRFVEEPQEMDILPG